MRLKKGHIRLMQLVRKHRANPVYHKFTEDVGREWPTLLRDYKKPLVAAGYLTWAYVDVPLEQNPHGKWPAREQSIRYDLTDAGTQALDLAEHPPSPTTFLEWVFGAWFRFTEARV